MGVSFFALSIVSETQQTRFNPGCTFSAAGRQMEVLPLSAMPHVEADRTLVRQMEEVCTAVQTPGNCTQAVGMEAEGPGDLPTNVARNRGLLLYCLRKS